MRVTPYRIMVTVPLTLLCIFATGAFNHLIFDWRQPSPGLYLKVVWYPFAKYKAFTIDRRQDQEVWSMHKPCPKLPRKELMFTWPDSTEQKTTLCNGQTVTEKKSLSWSWWFLNTPPTEPFPQSQIAPATRA